MTPIKDMQPGKEMDAKIAEAIGYVSLTTHLNTDGTFGTIPKYSTDISEAWELVKRLEPTHHFHCSRLHGQRYQTIEGCGYGVEFENNVGSYYAEGHTLSEAICKAALIAMNGGETTE